MPFSNVYNEDCLPAMRKMKDKQFDLLIADPPYFSGPEKRKFYGSEFSGHGVKRRDYVPLEESWEVPDNEWYQQAIRVSKHQIIFGINYFNTFQQVPVGRIIWDKHNDNSSFSNCEIASCSKIKVVRIFRFMWRGMMQGSEANGSKMEGNKLLNQKKIHPTEKPLQLYKWLLKKFAEPGDSILDTHMGSAISRVAAFRMGFDYTGYELNKHYFNEGIKRFELLTSQKTLF